MVRSQLGANSEPGGANQGGDDDRLDDVTLYPLCQDSRYFITPSLSLLGSVDRRDFIVTSVASGSECFQLVRKFEDIYTGICAVTV